ncbi:MAG: TIGR00725 family protein [Actinobacteria bacterium]|nr:TIGR00725 family protein [Actinomycetota bacterium]
MEVSPNARPYIGVVGAGVPDPGTDRLAEAVGRAVGESGAVLVCGGMTGVMEAACRGAKSAGGTTLGILPTSDRADANPYVDVAMTTGLGEIRNALVVRASDAVVAVRGETGTLSEIAFALKTGTPVVGIETWDLPGVAPFEDPVEAVTEALRLAGRTVK